jgi:hypothetical protein
VQLEPQVAPVLLQAELARLVWPLLQAVMAVTAGLALAVAMVGPAAMAATTAMAVTVVMAELVRQVLMAWTAHF